MDRRIWQATIHGVAKSQTKLRDFHFFFPQGYEHVPSHRQSEQVAVRGNSLASIDFCLVIILQGLELTYKSQPYQAHHWCFEGSYWGDWGIAGALKHVNKWRCLSHDSRQFCFIREGTEVKEVVQCWHTVVGDISNLPGSRVSKFMTLEGERGYHIS